MCDDKKTLKFSIDRLLGAATDDCSCRCSECPVCGAAVAAQLCTDRSDPRDSRQCQVTTDGRRELELESKRDETTANTKKRRVWSRAVFNALQRKTLEERFNEQRYITKPDRIQLAAVLGLTDDQVKIWFQNRRMKLRNFSKNQF